MKAILTQFASFLKNIGSQLIEFGVMIIAFKSALKSVLTNPWARSPSVLRWSQQRP